MSKTVTMLTILSSGSYSDNIVDPEKHYLQLVYYRLNNISPFHHCRRNSAGKSEAKNHQVQRIQNKAPNFAPL